MKVKDVNVMLKNIGGSQDETERNYGNSESESDDQEDVDRLDDIFEMTLNKEVPLWAEPKNCYEKLKKQEQDKSDIVKIIFAAIDLEDLDEEQMYKVPLKATKRPRSFSLNLDLSNLTFTNMDFEFDL